MVSRRRVEYKGVFCVMTVLFRNYLNERLQDPEFRAEYEAVQAEEQFRQAVIEAREASGLTEQQLAERTGLKQSDIMELESGQTEPTVKLLQQLAHGMGKRLRLELVPA